MKRAVGLVLAAALAGAASGAETIGTAFQRFDEAERATWQQKLEPAQRFTAIESAYVRYFDGLLDAAKLNGLSTADLHLALKATYISAFYSMSEARAALLHQIGRELKHRGELTQAEAKDVFSSLLTVRALDSARQWAQEAIPERVAEVPAEIDEHAMSGPTMWHVAGPGKVVRQDFKFADAQVLVIGSPQCHFSGNASTAISGDREISAALSGHVTWLAPQDATAISAFSEWNTAHPAQPYSIVYRSSEWSGFDTQETPIFYFLKDGRIVGKITGWPTEGRLPELRDKLRQIGLLH